VIGACKLAHWAGFERIIGFDMGGTSTDVFLADATGFGAELTRESAIAGQPVSVPMLDIHSAGAGGGSIARFDAGGMLRVGPESAAAEPGPICFGRGTMPTVTDANLLLGRLDPDSFLGGGVTLHRDRTEQLMRAKKGSLATVDEFAAGILSVVETQMEKAIRVISIERGHDPREFALMAFGGGGPLHACSLARSLRIPTVLVPAMPGALSAVGILLADAVRDYSWTVMLPGNAIESLEESFAQMELRGIAEFRAEDLEGKAQCTRTLDVRYKSQGYELNVPYDNRYPKRAVEAFHRLHRQRYGFCDELRPLEIVNLRLRMTAASEPWSPATQDAVPGNGSAACYATRDIFFRGRFVASRLYRRDGLIPGDSIDGPALVTEYTAATVLPPGSRARVDNFGNLVISIGEETTA
jgi:N-methylhydantoinase A